MARQGNGSARKKGSRVKKAVSRVAKKVTARLRPSKAKGKSASPAARPVKKKAVAVAQQARRFRPRTDVPMEALDRAYIPTQTSLKAGFRADGADRQRDQEVPAGDAEERWNNEDHFTNKSGDPRIGTHGRHYEPGE